MKTAALHVIKNQKQGHGHIIRKYSKYKFGSKMEISLFSTEILKLIRETVSINNSKDWIIVSPAFSVIPPAIFPICKIVSKTLNIPFIKLKAQNYNLRKSTYAEMNSYKARASSIKKMGIKIPEKHKIKNKNVLIIDDLIASGASVNYIKDYLEVSGASKIYCFVILKLNTKKLALENQINSFIAKDSFQEFITILKKRSTIFNRYTVKYLFLLNQEGFLNVIRKLSSAKRDELKRMALLYFGKEAVQTKLRTCKNH